MIIFVTGGSASGKSGYAGKLAERLSLDHPDDKSILYIATLSDRSEESEQRVKRHRQLRKTGSYRVKECFSLETLRNLSANDNTENSLVFPQEQEGLRHGIVIFDSLDGFTANVFFGETDSFLKRKTDRLAEKTAGLMKSLAAVSTVLIIVSDAVYSDGIQYDEGTRGYMEYTAMTEQLLVAAADQVVEVVCGIPLLLKGERDEYLQVARDNDVSLYENPDARN